MTQPPSNWRLSELGIREEELRCPKCVDTANRPGATLVELGQDGVAYCTVCSHAFNPTTTTKEK